jgi:1,2-diacylglycerol 3-alpha-glucosyltransferase
MRKIFFLNNLYKPNIGGIENSLFNLTKNINKPDVVPVIITSTINHFSNEKLKLNEKLKNVIIFRYEKSRFYFFNTLNIIFNVYKILKKTKANSSDIYVIRDKRMLLGIKLAVPFAKVKFLVPGLTYYQDFYFGEKTIKNYIFLIFNSFWEFIAMLFSSQIYVFSTLMSNQIKNLYNKKSKIVKPGVDYDLFKPLDNKFSKNDLKKEFEIPTDKLILLFTGRFSEQKGLPIILSNFLKLDHNKYHLILVGSGSLDEFIKKNTNNISNITIYRSTTEIQKFYQFSDIFLMSSEYEPFGQTILEAAACNLPVISIDDIGFQTATKEILGKYGFYQKKNDFLSDIDLCVNSFLPTRDKIRKEYLWKNLLNDLTDGKIF